MAKPFLFLLLTISFATNGFTQPRTLEYYLSKGLAGSPLLNDIENQLSTSGIDSILVLCGYKPQVVVTSQALIAPAGNNIGYDEAITNGGNYAAVIGVKQSLFNEKDKKAQLENISLLKQSIEVNRKISISDLKKTITQQYITAFADFSQIQFIRKSIQMLTDQQKAVKYLVEGGIYQELDLINLAIGIKAQEIAGKQAFIQFKNDVAFLNLISGILDTTTVQLARPELELTNLFDIRQSPVILQLKVDSLRNCNAKYMVDLNYRPKLEAFADAGFMAVKPLNIPRNFGASFGLNFSIPVYDGKQRLQEYKKLEIAEKSRMLYRDFYSTQYWQQYRQLHEQLRLTDELIRDIGSQLTQQLQLIDLYKVEIEKGLVSFTDFLVAVNNYSDTRNSMTVAEMNHLQLINQLNFLK